MAALAAVGIGWGSFAGMVPAVKAQIGAGDAAYGGLVLIASIGAIGSMWVVPRLYDLAGRWAMVLGTLMIALGFAMVGRAELPAVFALCLFIAAVGSAFADVLANAELAEAEARTGRALMNLNHGIYSFAFAGGAVAVALGRDAGAAPWQVLGLTGLLVAACGLAMGAPRSAAPPAARENGATPVMPGLLVGLGGIVVLAAFLSEAATEGWSALHLERTLGGSPALGALGPAVFGVTMGIGRLFGHVLANRMPDLPLMSLACLAAAAGLGLAAGAPSVAMAYLGFAAAGLGISVVVPLALGLVGRSVPEAVRLRAIARASALGYSAFFLGPPLMGGLSDLFGLRASFAAIAALLVVVAALLIPALARQVALTAGPR